MVWLRQETHQPAETSREAVFQSPLTTLHTTSRFSSVSWSSLQTTSEPSPHLVSLRWIFREFQTPSIHIHPTYFSYKRTAKAKCKKKKKKAKQPFTERKWLKHVVRKRSVDTRGGNAMTGGRTDIHKQRQKKFVPSSVIWTVAAAALIGSGCASVLAESPHPHAREARRETAWLVSSAEASTSEATWTTDDCSLATDETSHLQKTMIDENEPAPAGSVQRRKTRPLSRPRWAQGVWGRGDGLSHLSFLKISNVSSTFFLCILCIQHGNIGGIWWQGTFQSGKICNRSFPKILVVTSRSEQIIQGHAPRTEGR